MWLHSSVKKKHNNFCKSWIYLLILDRIFNDHRIPLDLAPELALPVRYNIKKGSNGLKAALLAFFFHPNYNWEKAQRL